MHHWGEAKEVLSFSSGSAAFVGFGFYWAWLMLVFYTPSLTPGIDAASPLIQNIWTWSAWAHAVTLLTCAFFSSTVKTLLGRRYVLPIASIVTTVATLLVAGSQFFPMEPSFLAEVLSISGAILSGAGTALLVLMWAEAYAYRGADFSLYGISVSFILSAAIFLLVMLFPSPIAIATIVVLPLLSGGALFFAARVDVVSKPGTILRKRSQRIPLRLALPLLAMFLYAFCGEVLRGFATLAKDSSALSSMGSLYVLGCMFGTLVFVGLLILVPAPRKEPGELPGIRPVLIIMAVGFLLTAIFNTSFFVAYAVFGGAFQCARVLVWTYGVYVIERTGVPPIRVFGITQGIFALAVVIGTPLVEWLASAITMGLTAWASIALGIVFLIFLSAVFLLNQKDLASVWGLVLLGEKKENCDDTGDDLSFLVRDYGLSPRELDVATLLSKGRSLPFIQEDLHIASGTAQTHLSHIYKKLGVHDRQAFLDLIEKYR